MKTYGNFILMATICLVIFWVLMALRPANAGAYNPMRVRQCEMVALIPATIALV